MHDLNAAMAAQREAFGADLPLSLAVRKDRLRRAVAPVGGHANSR